MLYFVFVLVFTVYTHALWDYDLVSLFHIITVFAA